MFLTVIGADGIYLPVESLATTRWRVGGLYPWAKSNHKNDLSDLNARAPVVVPTRYSARRYTHVMIPP